MTQDSTKEYKVRVTVGNMVYHDYLISAESSEEAFRKAKDALWNLTVRVCVEVQGELKITREVIRER